MLVVLRRVGAHLQPQHAVGVVGEVLGDGVDLAELAGRNDGGIEAEVDRREVHVVATRIELVKALAVGEKIRDIALLSVGDILGDGRVDLGSLGLDGLVTSRITRMTATAGLIIAATRRRQRDSNR